MVELTWWGFGLGWKKPPWICERAEMTTGTGTAPANDSEEARYYSIGEVARLTELKPFVLRYWEAEFPMLEPI